MEQQRILDIFEGKKGMLPCNCSGYFKAIQNNLINCSNFFLNIIIDYVSSIPVLCGSSHMNREEERIMNIVFVHRNDHELFVA